MIFNSLRRGGFVALACLVITTVCGRAMIGRLLRGRFDALALPDAPPIRPAGPGRKPHTGSCPQEG